MSKNTQQQHSKIYMDMKNYLMKVGLPIDQEISFDQGQYLLTNIKLGEIYSMILSVGHNLQRNEIMIQSDFCYSVPAEKRQKVRKLINLINQSIDTNRFLMDTQTGTLTLGRGLPAWDDTLDIESFNIHVKEVVRDGRMFFPLIVEQIYSNPKPKTLYRKYIKHQQRVQKKGGIIVDVGKKNTGNQRGQKQKKDLLPFQIHMSSMEDSVQFPTHTHGLHETGMPELFIDPLSMGPINNAQRVGFTYDYFANPVNKDKLEAVLNGKTVELKASELNPNAKDDTDVYCFREVSSEFEAVKMVYEDDETGIDPDMRFIQIWIKGDDYVLNDEYYKGGVMW